jgi:hypothetical protein
MSKKEVNAHIAATRGELAATLDEIEHRVSPAQLGKTAVSWVSESYDRSPARWLIGGGVAIVGAVAAVLWAVFTSDD